MEYALPETMIGVKWECVWNDIKTKILVITKCLVIFVF